jgi:ribosomal protein S4
LKKIVKLILKESKKLNIRAPILFIQKLEARLDTALYRTQFCYSFYNAHQLISHQKIYVNNKIIQHKFFELQKGDLITFDESIHHIIKSNLLNQEL